MKKYDFSHDKMKFVCELVDNNFYDVQSFSELNDKIASLPENWQEGAAWELWVNAWQVVEEPLVESYVHSSEISQEVREEWRFPINKPDYGIDSISYYFNDPIPMPNQIKFQSSKTQIDWGKLGKFFGAAQKFPYGRRCIIHNQEKVDDCIPKDSYISFGRKDFDDLEAEAFQRINKWLQGVSAEKLKKKLEYRDYQDDECVPQTSEKLATEDRAIIHAVCGAGKTAMLIKCIKDLIRLAILKPNMIGVIVVPSRFLIHQWLSDIMRWVTRRVLPICTPEELRAGESNVLSTTDPLEIAQFIQKHTKGISIALVTIDSYPMLADAVKLSNLNKLDFGCVDEAHNTTGFLTQRKTFFVRNEILKIDKRISITANLIERATSSGRAIVSMDNPQWYGNVSYRLNRKEALERGIICPRKLWYSVNITDINVDSGAVEFEGELFRADWTSNLYALKHFVEGEKRDIKRCIVLHNTLPRSKALASDTPLGIKYHMKNIWVGRIDGTMSLNKKAAIIRAFREAKSKGFERAFLLLVGCGLEGMNIPEADGLWYADPKNSDLTREQVTGRVERPSEESGKTICNIGMPLHLKDTEEETIEEAAHRTGYEGTVAHYRAMENDEYDGIIRLLQDEDGHTVMGYARDVIGETMPEITGIESRLAEELKQALITREIALAIDIFGERLEELHKFYEDHGHSLVPQGTVLGSWLNGVRQRYKAEILSEHKIKQLEAYDIVWNVTKAQFYEKYKKLKEDMKAGVRPRQGSDCVDSFHFVQATLEMIRKKTKSKGVPLEEKIRLFAALGLEAETRNQQDKRIWTENYNDVKTFKQENKRFPTSGDNATMANWLLKQKWERRNGTRILRGRETEKHGQSYRGGNPYPKWKIKLMDNIDFEWGENKAKASVFDSKNGGIAKIKQLKIAKTVTVHKKRDNYIQTSYKIDLGSEKIEGKRKQYSKCFAKKEDAEKALPIYQKALNAGWAKPLKELKEIIKGEGIKTKFR